MNPKAACLKRREEEKTEDLNTAVSITLAPHNYGGMSANENINTNLNNGQGNIIAPGTSSSVDGWWLAVNMITFEN